MMSITRSHNRDCFLDDFFSANRLKRLFLNLLLYIGLLLLEKRFPQEPMDIFYLSVMVIVVSFVMSYIPDFLKKEIVAGVHDLDWQSHEASYLCNCRKVSGPFIGALKIEKDRISFKSVRPNLTDKNFTIERAKHKSVSFEKHIFRWSIVENIVFPQLTRGICLLVDGKRIYFQTFEADRIVEDFAAMA